MAEKFRSSMAYKAPQAPQPTAPPNVKQEPERDPDEMTVGAVLSRAKALYDEYKEKGAAEGVRRTLKSL